MNNNSEEERQTQKTNKPLKSSVVTAFFNPPWPICSAPSSPISFAKNNVCACAGIRNIVSRIKIHSVALPLKSSVIIAVFVCKTNANALAPSSPIQLPCDTVHYSVTFSNNHKIFVPPSASNESVLLKRNVSANTAAPCAVIMPSSYVCNTTTNFYLLFCNVKRTRKMHPQTHHYHWCFDSSRAKRASSSDAMHEQTQTHQHHQQRYLKERMKMHDRSLKQIKSSASYSFKYKPVKSRMRNELFDSNAFARSNRSNSFANNFWCFEKKNQFNISTKIISDSIEFDIRMCILMCIFKK